MILLKSDPTADRLIIFSLMTTPNDRKEAADRPLQVANKTTTTHADIKHLPLILANITATNNLVFTVAPQHLSTSYKPYLAILEEALMNSQSHRPGSASNGPVSSSMASRLPPHPNPPIPKLSHPTHPSEWARHHVGSPALNAARVKRPPP